MKTENTTYQPGTFVTHKLSRERMLVIPVPQSERGKSSDDVIFVRQHTSLKDSLSQDFHRWFYACELTRDGVADMMSEINANLLKYAEKVMDQLEESQVNGTEQATIAHLMDTDENDGQRLREAIAEANVENNS